MNARMTRSSSGTTAPDQPEVREEQERRKAERRQAEAKAFRDMLTVLYSPTAEKRSSRLLVFMIVSKLSVASVL